MYWCVCSLSVYRWACPLFKGAGFYLWVCMFLAVGRCVLGCLLWWVWMCVCMVPDVRGRIKILCVCVRSYARMSVSVSLLMFSLSEHLCVWLVVYQGSCWGWECIFHPKTNASGVFSLGLPPWDQPFIPAELRGPPVTLLVTPSLSIRKPASGLGSPRTPAAGQDVKGSPVPRGAGLASQSRTLLFFNLWYHTILCT